ncbi:MAG: hypothetical protein QOK30_769 [Nocardioidaceae bacterium]|jgi:uncharacterized membrane-anchored protein YjiN (DUF445 family)|nr:hypothetical protein [Nocardioidaceae bacterium]
MRAVALSLLLFAAVVYLLTLHVSGAGPYIHATAEAAMVGAIADWFAVTAIFRHPLGLPIPHTAIIPTRKASLARSLQDFFTANFLSESVIRTRVADAQPSLRLGAWLTEPANSAWAVNEASTLARTVLERIQDADVAVLVETELLPRLAAEPLSEVVGRLLQDVVAEEAHHGLVDLTLSETHRWLSGNEAAFATALSTRAPWWTPQWLDEQVIGKLHSEAIAWVAEIRDDPRHHARRALDDLLKQLADDLQNDPDTIERAERLKQRVLSQPQVATTATSLWNALRRALLESLESPDSAVKARAVASLSAFGARLGTDEALRSRLDAYAADVAAFLVERYGTELTTVITDTIDRWDGKEAAGRIELFVGRDLQFIRVNGTIVGGLAGLLIYTVSVLL